jgi:hypothetical protein
VSSAATGGHVLLGIDEYPFHQITDTFAAVAGGDPSWNDGHYVCAADQAGTIALTSNVRLYANNDVLDGFVCLRHGGCGRSSSGSAPGRSPSASCGRSTRSG